MIKQNKIQELINHSGCFDLQFRKDVRHERTNSPTYYRWKAQFVIATPKKEFKSLKKIMEIFGCGSISLEKNQVRFSVQKIDDISEKIIPFFRKSQLFGNKKKDFELWKKAVDIIYDNKGKNILKWKKNDLLSLMQIHKSIAKYKNKPRQGKWIEMAKSMAKTI